MSIVDGTRLSLQDRIELLIFRESLPAGWEVTGVADVGDEHLEVRLTGDGRLPRTFRVDLTEIPSGT